MSPRQNETIDMNGPRYSPQESIGMNAVSAIMLQMGWIERPQYKDDVGIDLIVEECISGDPSGRLLALQVKSGKSYWKKISRKQVVFRFDQTHYRYWISHSLPVCVVLYDPDTGKAIWEHVSRKTCIRSGAGWKIHIPSSKKLSAKSASTLSRLAQRPSMQQLLTEEQHLLEELDHRFKARITATAEGSHVEIEAKERVSMEMHFSGNSKSIFEKCSAAFDRGKLTCFTPDELTLKGSPLFEHIMRDAKEIKIGPGKTLDATIFLVSYDFKGSEMVRIAIPSLVDVGNKFFSISTAPSEHPLRISIEVEIQNPQGCTVGIFHLDPDKWLQRPLRALPYFENVHSFLNSLSEGSRFELVCEFQGHTFYHAVSTNITDIVERYTTLVSFLALARSIAKRFGVNPLLPAISTRHVEEVEELHQLLSTGELSCDVESFSISCTLLANSKFLEMPEYASNQPAMLAIPYNKNYSMSFLETQIDVAPIVLIAHSVLVENREDVEREISGANDEKKELSVTFIGTRGCKVTRKLGAIES